MPFSSDSALRWFAGCGMKVMLPDAGAVATSTGQPVFSVPVIKSSACTS